MPGREGRRSDRHPDQSAAVRHRRRVSINAVGVVSARAAIADEIEGLEAKPLLYVQTSPPEGTVTPAGPITINVRGLAAPGAKVTIK